MLLCPFERVCIKAVGVESFVDIAVEGEQRGFAVAGREARSPGGVALDVERGERVAQVHQRGDVVAAVAAQYDDQRRRLCDEVRTGGGHVRRWRFVIQGLGGREQEQHVSGWSCPCCRRRGGGSERGGSVCLNTELTSINGACGSDIGAELSTAAGGRRLRRTHDRRGGQLVFTAHAACLIAGSVAK